MIRKFLTASALVAGLAMPAFADRDSSNEALDITADVEAACVMSDFQAINVDLDVIANSGSQNALALIEEDAELGRGEVERFGCNFAATIEIVSANGGLRNNNGGAFDPNQFTDSLNYEFNGNYVNGQGSSENLIFSVGTNGSTESDDPQGAWLSALDFRVFLEENSLRPVAGEYEDTLTFTIGGV